MNVCDVCSCVLSPGRPGRARKIMSCKTCLHDLEHLYSKPLNDGPSRTCRTCGHPTGSARYFDCINCKPELPTADIWLEEAYQGQDAANDVLTEGAA